MNNDKLFLPSSIQTASIAQLTISGMESKARLIEILKVSISGEKGTCKRLAAEVITGCFSLPNA